MFLLQNECHPVASAARVSMLVHFVSVIDAAEMGCERWRKLLCLIKRKYILSIKKVSEQKAMDLGEGGRSDNHRRAFKV